MSDIAGVSPGNPIRFRPQDARVLILAICGVFSLMSLITCCAVAVAMASMVDTLGSAVNAALDGLCKGLFSGLFEGVAIFLAAILLFLVSAFVEVMELLTLLSTGQFIPFFLRLAQFLGSM